MNQLQVFSNNEFGEVRTAYINNEPMVCLADVCRALEIGSPSDVKNRLNKDGVDTIEAIDSMGRKQKTIFINEANLYKTIFQSRKPKAEEFQDWVTSEVLPSIRKHGAYMTPETIQAAILNPDTLIRIATALKEEQEKNQVLQAVNSTLTVKNQIMQPKAEYFDELVDRNLLTNFRDTAKELGIKQKDFVGFLLDYNYIYRGKSGNLMPYSRYIDNGIFEMKECYNDKTSWKGTQTLITPKGRETFRLLCVERQSA